MASAGGLQRSAPALLAHGDRAVSVVSSLARELSVALLDLSDFAKSALSAAERKKVVAIAKSMVRLVDALLRETRKASETSDAELAAHLKDVDGNLRLMRSLVRDFPSATDRKNVFEQVNQRYAELVRGLTVVLAEA